MNQKEALIIGSHPMTEDVKSQYLQTGFCIKTISEYNGQDAGFNPDEIFVATCLDGKTPFLKDTENISLIKGICAELKRDEPLRIHLHLHSPDTLVLFQQRDIDGDLKGKAEIFPFTAESIWAENIFCQIPSCRMNYPPVDRKHITKDTDMTAHIVIIGMNRMAEAMAVHAALTCHYPNYTRNHSLRTRITMISPDMESERQEFINRHSVLFDNSWYRFIDLNKKDGSAVTYLHKPQYEGIREDFTDIEWEFVSGNFSDTKVTEKLKLWAVSDSQILTLILCDENEGKNINSLLQLPKELEDNMVTVLVRMNSKEASFILNGRKNVKAFGMDDCGYDISVPLVRLAKMINHVYDCCYEFNYASGNTGTDVFAPVCIDMEKMEATWKRLTNAKKWSNIFNAMTLSTKMRSLGHNDTDWEKFYGMTAKEIAVIAEVEHNRWNVEEMLLGFRPVTQEQEKEIESDISRKKAYKAEFIHYDIRAYRDLRPDDSGRNVNTYDICLSSAIPLIAKTFMEERNG